MTPAAGLFSRPTPAVGLNLQHASVVVNMDVPWNPAVLEQRIGRVHGLGQRQPVRVVNFVAQGSIEEGMLSVLKFKKSLFAGVLDGGEREVFLGGSRLTRFMETVEKTTAAIAEPVADDREEPPAAEAGVPIRHEPAAVTAHDGWSAIVQTGLTLLDQLGGAARTSPGTREGLRIVHRDFETGEDYLKTPLPSRETLDRALEGRPVKDFAERHGLTATNAGVRVFRAREALKKRVVESCGTCADHGCRDCSCRNTPHKTAPS